MVLLTDYFITQAPNTYYLLFSKLLEHSCMKMYEKVFDIFHNFTYYVKGIHCY